MYFQAYERTFIHKTKFLLKCNVINKRDINFNSDSANTCFDGIKKIKGVLGIAYYIRFSLDCVCSLKDVLATHYTVLGRFGVVIQDNHQDYSTTSATFTSDYIKIIFS